MIYLRRWSFSSKHNIPATQDNSIVWRELLQKVTGALSNRGSHMYQIVKECKPYSYKKILDVSGSQEGIRPNPQSLLWISRRYWLIAKYIKNNDHFNKAPQNGTQAVSPDSEWINVGGSKLKRRVLPGVNKPTQETEELTDMLGNIDKCSSRRPRKAQTKAEPITISRSLCG